MRRFAILADDLTGALDTAAVFASAGEPAMVGWSISGSDAGGFAIDTETRGADGETAARAVADWLPVLATSQLAFKKMDSLMRGNTIAELRACCGGAGFGSVVVAPAFPQQGRITRGGRQLARQSDGAWQAVGPCLRDVLPSMSCPVPRGAGPADRGISICDAEDDDDLARLVSASSGLVPPVLWCGTAGLARALAGQRLEPSRPVGRCLVVVGSRHWASAAQVRSLEAARPGLLANISSIADAPSAIERCRAGLEQSGAAALCFAMPEQDASKASDLYSFVFRQLRILPPPDILVAVGGDTLYRLCRAFDVTHLSALGEWSPGVAVSTIVGGLWDGATLISKSGAFGDSDFLLSVLARSRGH